MDPARYIATHLNRLRKVCCPWTCQPAPEKSAEPGRAKQRAGKAGEDAATRFLRKHGYKILRRNYRAKGGGEIDIVARQGQTLVFCEVKSRRSERFGRPFEAVDRAKEELIWRGARQWLRQLGNPAIRFRFDIIEVIQDENLRPREIRHLPDEGDARSRFAYSPQRPSPFRTREKPRNPRK